MERKLDLSRFLLLFFFCETEGAHDLNIFSANSIHGVGLMDGLWMWPNGNGLTFFYVLIANTWTNRKISEHSQLTLKTRFKFNCFEFYNFERT